MMSDYLNRREFLGTIMAGFAMGSGIISCQKKNTGGIPTRPLGKTGEDLSIIGLGGWDIADDLSEKESISLMHKAIDEGINFFDNCWEYHNGYAEEVMGKALAGNSRREKVFLMTKVCGRSRETAMQHLEDSLSRLRTGHIDLWQFHAIRWEDDPGLIFDPDNGAMKAALEAQKSGKIRYIGFTGHQDPVFHLAMLEKEFEWDSVQMPTNVLDPHYHSFQKNVLPVCVERNIGVLGMKALGAQNGRFPRELNISAELCRRYALSLPVTSLVCGISSRENLEQDLAIGRNFQPLNEEEIAGILEKTFVPAQEGRLEVFKTGNWGCDWHHNHTM